MLYVGCRGSQRLRDKHIYIVYSDSHRNCIESDTMNNAVFK